MQSSIRDLHGLASSSAVSLDGFFLVFLAVLIFQQEKKGKIEKLSLDFENFNTKFKQLASVATERMEDMPVSTRIDIDDRSGYAVSDPSSYRASMESDDDRTRLLGQQQQYMRLEADREFQDSLIRQRDLEIRSIQGQMIEVNEIFKDLAKLVDDQAVAVGKALPYSIRTRALFLITSRVINVIIDNIETNIVSAAENVKVAKEDLTKAEDTQVSSRKKLIGFAIFILIMVIVIVLVVVFTLRNKDS